MATYVVEWTGKSKEFSGSGDNVPARIVRVEHARRESWGGNDLWHDYTLGRK